MLLRSEAGCLDLSFAIGRVDDKVLNTGRYHATTSWVGGFGLLYFCFYPVHPNEELIVRKPEHVLGHEPFLIKVLSNVKEIISKTLTTQGTYVETWHKGKDLCPSNRRSVDFIRDAENDPFADIGQFPGDCRYAVTVQRVNNVFIYAFCVRADSFFEMLGEMTWKCVERWISFYENSLNFS